MTGELCYPIERNQDLFAEGSERARRGVRNPAAPWHASITASTIGAVVFASLSHDRVTSTSYTVHKKTRIVSRNNPHRNNSFSRAAARHGQTSGRFLASEVFPFSRLGAHLSIDRFPLMPSGFVFPAPPRGTRPGFGGNCYWTSGIVGGSVVSALYPAPQQSRGHDGTLEAAACCGTGTGR
jgi:hypothetical protein